MAGRRRATPFGGTSSEVSAFEAGFAAAVGAPHACAVANCTTALSLALSTVGVEPGSEVVTVSHSFIATANSVRHCGAVPVFVDVQPETLNIDPSRIAEAIGERTRAILVVHQLGLPADLAAIVPVARRHRVPLVEDAACAIGSEIDWDGQWERIGHPRGDVACFSFHPRKLVATGDSGMLTTANPDWDQRFRLMRQHGMRVPSTVGDASRRGAVDSCEIVGYNYRMTDIQAAVGREQLRKLPLAIERRRQLAGHYRELLAGSQVVPPAEPGWARTNWQTYWVRLPTGVDQRRVMRALLDEGIATRPGLTCAHREPAYPPGTWRCGAQERCLLLPLFHAMTVDEQETVAAALRRAVSAV